jgi:hypothetical protein
VKVSADTGGEGKNTDISSRMKISNLFFMGPPLERWGRQRLPRADALPVLKKKRNRVQKPQGGSEKENVTLFCLPEPL